MPPSTPDLGTFEPLDDETLDKLIRDGAKSAREFARNIERCFMFDPTTDNVVFHPRSGYSR